MKNTTIVIILLFCIIGFGGFFTFDKFTKQNAELSSLRANQELLAKQLEDINKILSEIKKQEEERKSNSYDYDKIEETILNNIDEMKKNSKDLAVELFEEWNEKISKEIKKLKE